MWPAPLGQCREWGTCVCEGIIIIVLYALRKRPLPTSTLWDSRDDPGSVGHRSKGVTPPHLGLLAIPRWPLHVPCCGRRMDRSCHSRCACQITCTMRCPTLTLRSPGHLRLSILIPGAEPLSPNLHLFVYAFGAWPKPALTRGSFGLLLNVSGERKAGLGSNSPLP